MNGLIEKLAEQTDLLSEFTPTKIPGLYSGYISEEQILRFAELIIKECLSDLKERIALRYQGSDKDRDIGYGMEIVYMDIVEKFGVE